MIRKKCGWIFCVCLCMFLLFGCGRRASRDEIAKDLQNDETASSGNADEEENMQELKNKHTQFEILGKDNQVIHVDADVTGLSELHAMHFYDAKRLELDESYIKSETADFFDPGTCDFYKPYNCCDAEELARTREALLSDIEAEEDSVMKQGMENELHLLVEKWMDSEPGNAQPAGEVLYEENYEGGYQSHCTSAKGKIDGVPFAYEYLDSVGLEEMDSFARMRLTRYDYMGEKQHVLLLPEEELAAKMADFPVSEEQAIKQADEFLERIGYTGFACRKIGYAENLTRLSNQKEKQDSWFLAYSRGRDGLTTVCCPGSWLQYGVKGELQTNAEVIYVLVNEDGVIRVQKEGQFYAVNEKGTKAESYISWEQVEDAAAKYLETFEMPKGSKNLTISQITLSYVYARYQSGQYCLVPVWSFEGSYSSEGGHFIFGVSAVDGEIIMGNYLLTISDVFEL